jgi:hypothetical protein
MPASTESGHAAAQRAPEAAGRPRWAARLGASWGLAGVVAILGDAVVRIWPYTREAVGHGLTRWQWVSLIGWVAAMVVGEGYRGFQKQFSPRVTTRRIGLLQHGRGIDLLLAPLYCIGYFHAGRRQVISSWSLTAGITLLVIAVRNIAQPWRGIVDAGVLAGLGYGLATVIGFAIQHRLVHGRVRSAP